MTSRNKNAFSFFTITTHKYYLDNNKTLSNTKNTLCKEITEATIISHCLNWYY